jgi:hypothetical protein
MQRVFELLDDISWQNKALGIIVHCPEEYFARRLYVCLFCIGVHLTVQLPDILLRISYQLGSEHPTKFLLRSILGGKISADTDRWRF